MTLEEHLKWRHLDLNLHRPVLDEENDVATFYLWNLSGQLVGYQQYRRSASKTASNDPRSGRYFTFRKLPTIAVWGVESLHLTPKILFVTEGLFDACRLTELGVSAIAVLSNDSSKDLKNWLTLLHRKIVAVCDNDKAGKELAKFGDEAIFMKEKDLGDSSPEEVEALINKFTTYLV